MSRKCHLSFLALVIAVFFTNCSDDSKPIDGVKSKVVKVITGNKIELQNGLTVELLGIKATEDTKEYLEKMVLGETVTLLPILSKKGKLIPIKPPLRPTPNWIVAIVFQALCSRKELLNYTKQEPNTTHWPISPNTSKTR